MAGTKLEGRRAHAFAAEEADVQVGRLMGGLAAFCGGPGGVARALRAQRKAARAGGPGYDPARHAALLRLQRLCAREAGAQPVRGTGSSADAGRGAGPGRETGPVISRTRAPA